MKLGISVLKIGKKSIAAIDFPKLSKTSKLSALNIDFTNKQSLKFQQQAFRIMNLS